MDVDVPDMAMAGHDEGRAPTNVNKVRLSFRPSFGVKVMLASIRTAASRVAPLRMRCAAPILVNAFSTSSARSADLSRLSLIGTLVRDPETRLTKNDKEYVMYVLARHEV